MNNGLQLSEITVSLSWLCFDVFGKNSFIVFSD